MKNSNRLTLLKQEYKQLLKANDKKKINEFINSLNSFESYSIFASQLVYNTNETPTYFKQYSNTRKNECQPDCKLNATCINNRVYKEEAALLIRNSITDEVVYYNNIGLWHKMASKAGVNNFWINEVIDEIKAIYYQSRFTGHSISHARQTAKINSFEIVQNYNGSYKAIQANYKTPKNCQCSECYFKRSYNCLNGTVIEYIPEYLNINEKEVKEELNSLIFAQYLQTEKRVKIKTFINRLLNLCKDEKDVLIIELSVQGKRKNEIAMETNLTQRTIYNRIVKIGTKYQHRYLD